MLSVKTLSAAVGFLYPGAADSGPTFKDNKERLI